MVTKYTRTRIMFFTKAGDRLAIHLFSYYIGKKTGRGSSVDACPRSRDRPARHRHILSLIVFHSKTFADSRRASCQLLAKKWVLNTGKLHPRGLSGRNSVVK